MVENPEYDHRAATGENLFFGLLWQRICLILTEMAGTTLNPGEEAQLLQTIEMFEVIVQSQPSDTQSLEILKEAYTKMSREQDVVNTSKRIAQAYLQQGQLSSAILEYETVLQRRPDDADVRAALKSIEDKAGSAVVQPSADSVSMTPGSDTAPAARPKSRASSLDVDDGRKTMYRIFVESKLITAGDFDLCWRNVDLTLAPTDAVDPFIQMLHEKGIYTIDKSLRLISDKSRVAYLPLDRYDVDMDLARGFPADVCRRWCVLPFDRMSKAILVATANPFNQQAAKELAEATTHRLLWYLASPNDIVTNLRKAFR
jgi:tetratricopeptide (TPR) repeat protein